MNQFCKPTTWNLEAFYLQDFKGLISLLNQNNIVAESQASGSCIENNVN